LRPGIKEIQGWRKATCDCEAGVGPVNN